MKWSHTEAEKADIEDLFRKNRSAIRALKKDWTHIIINDCKYRLQGPIPRNWVINITGGIGTPSGVFKSALGLILARLLDPSFNIAERVAFTTNELNIKVKEHATAKQIFFRDESPHDLKESQMVKLQNIIEHCREQQMCFIMCGIPKEFDTFSSYVLERFDESDDKYLPKKRVRYLVKNPDTGEYRGVFIMDIPELNNPDGSRSEWGLVWDKYMEKKREHQDRVRFSSITDFDFKYYGEEFLKDGYEQFLKTTKKDKHVKIDKGLLGMEIRSKYADWTMQEKNDIIRYVIKKIEEKIKKDI